MTNHHYHAGNDHANNSLRLWSVLNHTDIRNRHYNLRTNKMKGGIRFLENVLFFGSYKYSQLNYIILSYAHRHIAVTMTTLKAGNCSSTLCNTNIGRLDWENADYFTIGSSLTVFLWMWIKRILVIWIQNLWQDVSNREHLHLSCNMSYLLLSVISKYHTLWNVLFLYLVRKWKN